MRTIIASVVFVGSVVGVYFLFPNLVTFKSAKAAVEQPTDWEAKYKDLLQDYKASEETKARVVSEITEELTLVRSLLKKEKEETVRLNGLAVEMKSVAVRAMEDLEKANNKINSVKDLINGKTK